MGKILKISDKGIELITSFEGLRLKTYRCAAGVLTIGYGHTGPGVVEGLSITKEEAVELFKRDISRFEEGVSRAVVIALQQHEFDALVSLAYNIGLGAFRGSTLLRMLNEQNRTRAADEFLKWNKVKGVEAKGLTARRRKERDVFLGRE